MQIYRKFEPSTDNLSKLIYKIENGKENDCRDILINFCEYIAEWHQMNLECVITEYCSSGRGERSDLILCGNNAPGAPSQHVGSKKVVIYECKNPNVSALYKKRAEFNKCLLGAETQLSNYYAKITDEKEGLRKTITAYQIDIELGGIILGSSCDITQDMRNLMNNRIKWIYNGGIKMFLWLDLIEEFKRKVSKSLS